MTISLATPADFEAVNALARQVHEMHVAWRPDLFRTVEHPVWQEWFSQLLEKKQLWVLREGDEVLAYAVLDERTADIPGLVPRKVLIVEHLCVADGHRRQGLGRKFMEGLMEHAKAAGCTDLQLTVDPHNVEAIAFYESLGMNVKQIQYHKKI